MVTSLITPLIQIRLASCMLASGSDDGTFSIRDLRLLKVYMSDVDIVILNNASEFIYELEAAYNM